MRRAFALVLGLIVAGGVRSDEEKVPVEKLPKAVLAIVKTRFPKAEVTGGAIEVADGKTVYEVTLRADGKTVDVSVTPEGVITTIEKEIERKDLPKAAAAALEKKYPGAAYKMVEQVVTVAAGKETTAYYEALLATADKKTVEVEVTADGTIKKTEDKTGEKK